MYASTEIETPDLDWLTDSDYSELDRWLNRYHGVESHEAHLRDSESLQRLRRAYCALVSYVDHKVGQLLSVLKEQRLLENTVVIFTSDHGDMLGERGMVQKRTFYEFSSRVPLLIRFPDGWKAGTTSAIPVSLVDIFPTLVDIGGATADEHTRVLDGESLVRIATHHHEFGGRRVFSEYHSLGAYAPCFMVRDNRYKYVYVHGYGRQLFDLAVDPGERTNLISTGERPEVERRLHHAIEERFDISAIESAVEESIARRLSMKEAMKRAHVTWDYQPQFDPKKGLMDQYLPRSETSTIPR